MTNPQGAANLDGFASVLEVWDTNIRLFKAAGCREPEGDAKRIAFVKLLPPDVRAHVALHQDMPQYQDFTEFKRFALKYIKVMAGLNAERRRAAQPLKLFEEERVRETPKVDEYGNNQGADEPEDETVDIKGHVGMEVAAKVEILAFMRAQGYKLPTRVPRRAGLCALPEVDVGQRRLAEVEASGEIPRPAVVLICPVSTVAGRDTQRVNAGSKSSTRASGRASSAEIPATSRDSALRRARRRSKRSMMALAVFARSLQ